MKWIFFVVAFLSLLATPAIADTYGVNFYTPLHNGYSATVTGEIVTDGLLGPLSSQDILSATLSTSVCNYACSLEGGTLANWSPGSLIATQTELLFDFGSKFDASLAAFGTLTFSPYCPQLAQCGSIMHFSQGWYTTSEFQHLGTWLHSPAPALSGAWLIALLGLFFCRKKKEEPEIFCEYCGGSHHTSGHYWG